MLRLTTHLLHFRIPRILSVVCLKCQRRKSTRKLQGKSIMPGASEDESKLQDANLVDRLPTTYGPARGDQLPADLRGATLMGVGAIDGVDVVEGGGLIIDYRTIEGV